MMQYESEVIYSSKENETIKNKNHHLKSWFSTFLKPQHFNTVPCVVVTTDHKIIFSATSYL